MDGLWWWASAEAQQGSALMHTAERPYARVNGIKPRSPTALLLAIDVVNQHLLRVLFRQAVNRLASQADRLPPGTAIPATGRATGHEHRRHEKPDLPLHPEPHAL